MTTLGGIMSWYVVKQSFSRCYERILTLPQLKEYFIPVLGGKDCASVSRILKDGETFKIGEGITVRSLYTPCHTQDSICYFMEDGNDRAVFTGDTLFIAGKNFRV